NDYGKNLGFKINDELVAINGKALVSDNFNEVINDYKKNTQEGDKITITIERLKKKKKSTITLKAKATKAEKTIPYFIEINPSATLSQISLRKAWLGE
ncbi:MAG: hypothetical protein CVT95_05505, partial [Bacteroidetes bacterium HGW-Bacteroidetes-12]